MIPNGRRVAFCALLAAVALAIFVLEAQIPLPVPVPGMKLGLSNLVTLFALFSLGWKEALSILNYLNMACEPYHTRWEYREGKFVPI